MVLFDVDQAGWGSSLEYDDGDLNGEWDPRYVIIHWGGLTRERDSDELAFETLRSWQRFHTGKGWQDIAYNYAVTEEGTICRLRGENHGGHTSGTDPVTGKSWSTVGVGVVWVGGQSDEDGPSPAAREAMGRLVRDRGLPVLGHQDVKATGCPGSDWMAWIDGKEWEQDGGVVEDDMDDFIQEVFDRWSWDEMEAMRAAGMWTGDTDYFKAPGASPAWVDVYNVTLDCIKFAPVFASYEDAEVVRRGESVELT